MKKVTLSLVAAGIAVASLNASAALATEAAPFQAVVPNLKSGFIVNLEGIYVRPTNSDLEYSEVTIASNRTTSQIDPKFDFGFRAGLGYIIPDSGNDVQLNWTHFDHDDSDSVYAPSTNITDTGTVSYKYDALDLEVGQYLSLGTRLQNRLFLGLRGVQLKSDESIVNIRNITPSKLERAIYENSKFTGIGPRAGIDSTYHVGNGFGIAAHLAGSLLVGTVEASGSSEQAGAVNPTFRVGDSTKVTRAVPAIDAKLGVNYSMPFNNQVSNMTIEAGYQATRYFNVIDYMNVNVHGSGTTVTTTTSVGFNGPYLSLNFKI